MSRIRDIANILSASTDISTDAELNAHSAAADPHTGYLKESEFNAAGKNLVINGGFDYWQRGTSFTGSNTYIYTSDRWAWRDTSGGNGSLLQVTSSLPDGFQYGLKLGRVNASTMTNAQLFQQGFETGNSIPLANKTVTLSFYAKKGANFSPSGVSVILYSGTGTNQTVGGTTGGANSWTGSATPINENLTTLTTSWVRYSYTGTIASTATQLAVHFQLTPSGTAGADDYFYVTGVQVEIGSTATSFSKSGGTIQGELAACQRYYWILSDAANDRIMGNATYFTPTEVFMPVRFPVTMRVSPTFIGSSGANYYRMKSNSTNDDFNSFTQDQATINQSWLYNNTEVAGTGGYAGVVTARTTSSSLAWSAEL